MAHIFETGTRAWQPDATEGWIASEVVDKQIAGDKVKLVFQLENGEVRSREPPESAVVNGG
jgi:myosin-5